MTTLENPTRDRSRRSRRRDSTTAPEKRQLKSIQIARGLAALFVVAVHATSTEVKYFGGIEVLPGIFRDSVGVDLFFVISGFVLVLTTRGRRGTPREVGRFVWNRFSSVYPTYWFYFVLLLPIAVLAPGWINASQRNEVDLFASFFLLPSDLLPLLLVTWSLTIVVWTYIVFAAMLFLPERLLPVALGVWLVILVVVNWSGEITASPFLEMPANPLAIEFIFGAVAALLFRRIGRVLAVIIAMIGISIVVVIGAATVRDDAAGPVLLRPLTLGLGLALIMLAVTAWERRSELGFLGRFTIIGDISFSVYLCHILVLAVMGRIWAAFAGPLSTSIPAIIAWWVLTFVAVFVAGYVSWRFVERPIAKVSQRWRKTVFGESVGAPRTVR